MIENPENLYNIELVQIDLDEDVLAWLKSYGPDYEIRLNAILREAMLKELKK